MTIFRRFVPQKIRRASISSSILLTILLPSVLQPAMIGAQQPALDRRLITAVGNPPYNPSRPFNVLEPKFDPDYRQTPPQISAPTTTATFWAPKGLALDSQENLFVADSFGRDYADTADIDRSEADFRSLRPSSCGQSQFCSDPIRKVVGARVFTVAGGTNTDEVPQDRALMANHYSVEIHKHELYIGTRANITKITTGELSGIDHLEYPDVSHDQGENTIRVAGQDSQCSFRDGMPATEGCLNVANDMAFDEHQTLGGSLFVTTDDVVKRVFHGDPGEEDRNIDGDSAEIMSVVVGLEGTTGSLAGDGGPAKGAALFEPTGLAFDRQGNLYISDTYNHRIRKVDAGVDGLVTGAPDDIISSIAGTGGPGIGPDFGKGFLAPSGLPAGQRGWNGDGPAKVSLLDTPRDIEFDEAGNLYVADAENDRLRKITPGLDGEFGGPDDSITTVAGGARGTQSGRDANNGVPSHDRRACQGVPCHPLDAKLEHPFGLAIVPCEPGETTTDMYVSEWMNRRVRLISGVAECPKIDLAIEDISDNPDPVVVGNDLEYTVRVANMGTSAATGVNLVSSLPPDTAFRSASGPRGNCSLSGPAVPALEGLDPNTQPGSEVTCPIGGLAAGASETVKVVVAPAAPRTIQFAASVSALNPEETADLLGNNRMTEDTEVKLPELPALPPLAFQPPAGGSPTTGTNPPPAAGPPATTSIDTQSTITLAPPAGPGAASPSTAPVPVSASQPFPGKVPLTGSAGFQPGLGAAPGDVSSATQAGTAAATSTMAVAAAAFGDAEKQESPAPRFSMVARNEAIPLGTVLFAGVFLLGIGCMGSRRPLIRQMPAWSAGLASGSRSAGRPAF